MSDHLDRPDGICREGFTGTVTEFLEWLGCELYYGGVVIGDPFQRAHSRHPVRQIELITSGFSADEEFLSRVSRSLFGYWFWRSTHAGGRFVYEVPCARFDSTESVEWLKADDDVVEELHRARLLIVSVPGSDPMSFSVPAGVEVTFAEHNRDINVAAGIVTIRAIKDSPAS